MQTFLDRVDAVPLQATGVPFQLGSWLSVLVDSLNNTIQILENAINLYNNGLIAPSFTTTEINALFSASELEDGVILYDSTLNVYVGQVSGTLMSFQLGSYP